VLPLIAILSVTIACAVLSGFVVARRWAFVGEGIGHSGFGGAGTAWLLACAFPLLDDPNIPYIFVVVFALAAAAGIAYLSRPGSRFGALSGDAAVGVFLVGSVAWGFVGQRVYVYVRQVEPAGFTSLFFGEPAVVSPQYAFSSVMVAAAVVIAVFSLRKEMLAYCIDPMLAHTSGVRSAFIHYLLVGLIALVIVIGVNVVGTLLVTALLILPGVTAGKITTTLRAHTAVCVAVAIIGALGGSLIHLKLPFFPTGPAVVLIMIALFLCAVIRARFVRQ